MIVTGACSCYFLLLTTLPPVMCTLCDSYMLSLVTGKFEDSLRPDHNGRSVLRLT